MYRCFLINFSYFLETECETLTEAIEYGRSKGYEFLVYHKNVVVATCMGPSLTMNICNSNYHHAVQELK